MDAYWRAANYLSVGQIYLLDNPLLREPLQRRAHQAAAARALGHHARAEFHLRAPESRDCRARPERHLRVRPRPRWTGHGGQHLPRRDATPSCTRASRGTRTGMRRLFKQFSFPGGIPSHAAPETPGSINEGGELGYSLAHAYGAAFDNPDLLVACVVGDGEAETGPLATAWHSNKFLNPVDRRRRPADPAPQRLQDRQPDDAGAHPARRAGVPVRRLRLPPALRRGRRPAAMHQLMAATLDRCWTRSARSRATRAPAAPASARAGR